MQEVEEMVKHVKGEKSQGQDLVEELADAAVTYAKLCSEKVGNSDSSSRDPRFWPLSSFGCPLMQLMWTDGQTVPIRARGSAEQPSLQWWQSGRYLRYRGTR